MQEIQHVESVERENGGKSLVCSLRRKKGHKKTIHTTHSQYVNAGQCGDSSRREKKPIVKSPVYLKMVPSGRNMS
jgi:hypothetical protein